MRPALRRSLLLAPLISLIGCGGGHHHHHRDDRPDLAFAAGPTVDPGDPLPGETFAIRFRIGNYGVHESPPTQWRLSRDGLGGVAIGAIPPLRRDETTGEITILIEEDPGVWTYRLELDQAGVVDDARRSNNAATITIPVTPLAVG